jgi:toxin HigB-1
MITSFACADTQALFHGRRVPRFVNIERAAIRKLQMLDAAHDLRFLRSPPGNMLEPLHGDRAGQYSMRINVQWRLCFHFDEGDADDVAIVDYH